MKLGIVGMPGAGKKTVFEALTGNAAATAHMTESQIGTVKVPDPRVDFLSDMYRPKKTIFAQVEYFLPAAALQQKEKGKEQGIWVQVRDCDALIHVLRNFTPPGMPAADPASDFSDVDQ